MWRPDLVSQWWLRARQSARSVIGIPDYDTYVRHCREHHPETPPMNYEEFFAERQAARYRGTGGRCC